MKPQALLVALVVVAVVAALPLAESQAASATPWPCCDKCGACTRSDPPQCRCLDASPSGCRPECKNCVRSTSTAGTPLFVCNDLITNFCLRTCTRTTAA